MLQKEDSKIFDNVKVKFVRMIVSYKIYYFFILQIESNSKKTSDVVENAGITNCENNLFYSNK